MKVKMFFTLALFVFFAPTAKAQFNTITHVRRHAKVEMVTSQNNKEAPPECDTSSVYVADSLPIAALSTQETEWNENQSVSYPLRQSKLVITSPYGLRRHPVTGKMKLHEGVDLRANFEPIYAMLPGEVLNTGYEPKGGNFISLKHGNIKVTYCHLSHIAIAKGAKVYAGQPIGISGNSGKYTTGPHLHLSVKDMTTGKTYSPTDLLRILQN